MLTEFLDLDKFLTGAAVLVIPVLVPCTWRYLGFMRLVLEVGVLVVGPIGMFLLLIRALVFESRVWFKV